MHSLCTALCSHPVLALLDFTKPFWIENNKISVGIGLKKKHASVYIPIALFLVLPLWFLALYCIILPSRTLLAALHILLPHFLQPWTAFWWSNLLCCAYLQLRLTLTTLKWEIFPNWLALLTPNFALFTSFLFNLWPNNSPLQLVIP